MTLTVTFKLGTDVDKAQVQVQNRVRRRCRVAGGSAAPRRHDHQAIARPHDGGAPVFAQRPLRHDVPAQLRAAQGQGSARADPGVGQVQVFGSGDYAMRVWLDPDKVAARGLTASDVVSAIREQNVQVAAGVIGAAEPRTASTVQLHVNAKGRLPTEDEFGHIIVKTGPTARSRVCTMSRASNSGVGDYALRSLLNNKTAVAIADLPDRPAPTRCSSPTTCAQTMAELKKRFSRRRRLPSSTTRRCSCAHSIEAVIHTLLEAIAAGRHRRDRVPADLARVDHSAGGGAGVARRHIRACMLGARLLDQHAVAVRPGAGDRHRRRRRDRRGRKRRAKYRGGPHRRSKRPTRR